MTAYNDLIRIIETELKKFGIDMPSGCDDSQIEKQKPEFEQQMGYTIDEDYLSFIKIINGIEYNGFILYSFCEEGNTESIISANMTWIDGDPNMRSKCVFAESDMDLYIKNTVSGKYTVVSKYSDTVFESFTSFYGLLEYGIKKYFL